MSENVPEAGNRFCPNLPVSPGMKRWIRNGGLFLFPVLLAACASVPLGPSVLVLPGAGKSFDQFRGDDAVCRQYAAMQTGGATPTSASATTGVGGALLGTALGAAAGAAIGGGNGAAIGAGTGLLAGGLIGSGMASDSGDVTQRRYDMGYVQCMYAKGHKVPVSGQMTDESSAPESSPAATYPPPPPGTLSPTPTR